MEGDKFLHAYQTVKFLEDSSDSFSLAATKRRTMALNFYGCLNLQESKHVTEFLLNEDLKEYGKLVDNKEPGGINNYADFVLSLLSNYQNDDLKNWKTGLNDLKIEELLDPLPCSNGINCKNSKSMSTSLKPLKYAFSMDEEKEEPQIPQAKNINNFSTSRELSTKPFVPKFNTVPRSTPLEPKIVRKENVPVPQKDDNLNKPKENFFFRTARDELQIQNAKKFGKSGGATSNDKTYNYGAVKKSLGTRKVGVYGKFQPPIRSKENTEEEPQMKMDVDESVDERLKNIDPNMIELIKNEIMDCGSKINWDDIAGLHLAKNTIQEIVVWPMLRPDIFTGLRRPPKGILLFGPPGTGKTLIGKCIASQSNSTFFSISASSLTSKWVGDGEKMVRTLFAVAKVYQPSVVFIDEIDSLLSQRSDSEHECSRRIKTEFLVQLDGAGTGEEDKILIIGATNRPQELDEAARRRLVKRLYIPLPDEEARKQIITNLISTEHHCLTQPEIEHIAKLTKGYSGADVKNLCQEASLGPIRSIPSSMIHSINPEDVRPLNAEDFESALCRIKSSVSESDLDIYVAWDKQYGCGSGSNIKQF